MKQPLEVLPYLNLFGSSKQSVSLPFVKALLSVVLSHYLGGLILTRFKPGMAFLTWMPPFPLPLY